MREVFQDAIEAEFIKDNPAGDGIKNSLSGVGAATTEGLRTSLPCPIRTCPTPWNVIRHSQGMRETRLALEFVVLTAARGGEVRGATWDEVEGDLWVIPSARMKATREHRVPLSVQAQLLLREARDAVIKRQKRRPDYNPNGLIFPHPSGKPLSENALSLRVKKDGLGCNGHGFRSSFPRLGAGAQRRILGGHRTEPCAQGGNLG